MLMTRRHCHLHHVLCALFSSVPVLGDSSLRDAPRGRSPVSVERISIVTVQCCCNTGGAQKPFICCPLKNAKKPSVFFLVRLQHAYCSRYDRAVRNCPRLVVHGVQSVQTLIANRISLLRSD